MQIAKHDLMRSTNTLRILECIRDLGPLTKREIQEKTGLSWGAVSNITTDLLKKKVINEFKSVDSFVGRTPSKLDINGLENIIVGLELNAEGITAILADIKCRVINKIRAGIRINEKNEILKQLKEMVYSILQTPNIDRNKILGIGVAVQGTVDAERGVSVFSPYFNEWTDVPIGQILEDEFHVPVFVEHDPNCMALSEKWFGTAREVDNLLFIRLSMGIGMSIIINGTIYRGADGSAGEFGHIIMNPGGPKCSCGNFGCLEAYASGRSILQKAVEGMRLGKLSIPDASCDDENCVNLRLASNLARKGNAYLKGIYEDAGIYLGIGISNLINIFNPELIVLGGELAKHSDLFINQTREIVRQKTWKNARINLVISKMMDDSAAIGAAALLIQKVFLGEMKEIII